MTPQQKQLLNFIVDYQRDSGGVSPSFEEMAEALVLKSKSGIHRLLSGLEQRGHIARRRMIARTIEVLNTGDTPVSLAELNHVVRRLAEQEGPERIVAALDDLARALALQPAGEA